MLQSDADKRPSFLELREILRAPQLALNLNNQDFVEGILREKMQTQRMPTVSPDELMLFQSDVGKVVNNRTSY